MFYCKIMVLLLPLSFLCSCAQMSTEPTKAVSNPAVTLDASEIFSLYSNQMEHDYRIRVRLPASYESEPQKRYPIVFKVDGQWDFLLAASAYNCIYFDGQMPEAIFIGIDWGDIDGDIHALRARDLLPYATPRYPNSGHANIFINALANEIIPKLEKKYRSNGDRFLMGGSWGGTFASHALLQSPETFKGAIAIAGAYKPIFAILEEQLLKLKQNGKPFNHTLYIAAGSMDPITPEVEKYADAVKKHQIEGLTVKYQKLKGFGHSGANVPAYAAGYQTLFAREDIRIPTAQLDNLRGIYFPAGTTSTDRQQISIDTAGAGLSISFGANEPIILKAESENDFYHPGQYIQLHFSENSVTLKTFFGKTIYTKQPQ